MQTLFDQTFSVTQVNEYAKMVLSRDPILSSVRVRGEISNLKKHSSGHIYFSLKDSEALLRCAFFRQDARKCTVALRDGLSVTARGYITVYPRDGAYQLVVNELRADGEGELYLQFLQIKQELSLLGLFDPARKKPIPGFCKKIGIITSPTGAVVHDIAKIARARFPGVEMVLFPVRVQGEGAAQEIAAAIARAGQTPGLDVLICGRGGGSMEDLWAFNEKIVALAAAECPIPLISAVGHETDFTILDFAADVRAATPTDAARLCTADAQVLAAQLGSLRLRARKAEQTLLDMARLRLDHCMSRPVMEDAGAFLQVLAQKRLLLAQRAQNAMQKKCMLTRSRLDILREKAQSLGPNAVLQRGYAIIKKDDLPVTSAQNLAPGDIVTLTFFDGERKAAIQNENL